METTLEKLFSRSVIGAPITGVVTGDKKHYIAQRDWAYAFPLVYANALEQTELSIHNSALTEEEKTCDLKILDELGRWTKKAWEQAVESRVSFFLSYQELLNWIKQDVQGDRLRIHTDVVNNFYMGALSYLFTPKEHMMGMTSDQCTQTGAVFALLGTLSQTTRKKVLDELQENGLVIPGQGFDCLRMRAENYAQMYSNAETIRQNKKDYSNGNHTGNTATQS